MLGKMKILSYNVAGLRACVKKGLREMMLVEDADIICLQETKCPNDILVFDGYHAQWNVGKVKGYAGIATLSKIKCINSYSCGEGRLMMTEHEDFYLVNVYVPNSGKSLQNRLDWNQWFMNYLSTLKNKKIIVCGDMNVSHNDIDIYSPKTLCTKPGFLSQERCDFTKLLDDIDLDDLWRLCSGEPGYTFWSYMGGCKGKNLGRRLDYFLCNATLVYTMNVLDKHLMSDHCPITLTF